MTDPQADEQARIERVETVLASETPPLEPLASTTDYRQLLDAWAVRHGLSLEETLDKLAADPNPAGAAWVAKIRAHPESEAAMEQAIAHAIVPEADDDDDAANG
jgi:hypothetical protein